MAHLEVGRSVLRLSGWLTRRADSSCNSFSKQTFVPASVKLPAAGPALASAYPYDSAACDSSGMNSGISSKPTFLVGPLNSCIAHKLREAAPGAMSGSSLLLSAENQRQILDTTRQRAQIGLVHYARLAGALASEGVEQCDGIYDTPLRSLVRTIDKSTFYDATLAAAGSDFADILQLYLAASGDVQQLLRRSGSARSFKGTSGTVSQEDWGEASWRQRGVSLLAGGDPLRLPSKENAPWAVVVPNSEPWPSAKELPFVQGRVTDPGVLRLESLARSCDVLDVLPSQSSSFAPCRAVDRAATGARVYRAVEACLRTRDCAVQTGSTCQTVSPADPSVDPGAGFESFHLWQQLHITPDHAVQLGKLWGDRFEPICRADSGGLGYQSGVNDMDGLIEDRLVFTFDPFTPQSVVHVGQRSREIARTLDQSSPLFARAGRVLIPSRLFLGASSRDQGFPADINLKELVEEERLGGVAATLAAVRETVVSAALAGPSLPMARQTKLGLLLAQTAPIIDAIGAAVGDRQINVRPRPAPVDPSNLLSPVVQETVGSRRVWDVDVVVPEDDAWWSTSSDLQLFVQTDSPWAAARHRG